MTTAIYTRLSEDKNGAQTATARQEADCRQFAEERGWTVSRVYEDVDLSAFNKKVTRPGFEEMVEAVRAGTVSRVLVWKVDRLVRQPRDLERMLDALERSGGAIASVNDPVDVSGPMGVAMLRIGVVMANVESSNISLRGKRKAAEIAAEGRAGGGGWRAYGYTADRAQLVPDEAERIREAAARLLAGESSRSIITRWNAEGVKSSSGRDWSLQSFTRMMRNPAIAGLRTHHDVVVADAVWPAIITRDEHEQLAAVLDPARRRTTDSKPRRYVLAGLLRCDVCGAVLVSRPRLDKTRRYVCAKGPGLPGCGGIAIMADPLEELIAETVFAALDTPKLGELLAAQSDSAEADERIKQLHADGEALEALAIDFYTNHMLDRQSFIATKKALEDRIEANRSALGQVTATRTLAGLDSGEAVRKAWAERDLAWRRGLLATVLDRVTVARGRRGYNKFDASRVSVTWRA